jgi:hypothetical protein
VANWHLRRLAKVLRNVPTPSNAPSKPATPMFGTVTAVTTTVTGAKLVDLTIGATGGSLQGASVLKSYSPAVGDTVHYHMVGGTPVVLGAIATS